MKIYAYNIAQYMHEELKKKYPEIIFIKNTENLLEEIKAEDIFICMWDDKDTLNRIKQIENELFPRREIIQFSANREEMTRFVQEHSNFKAEREYVKFEGTFTTTVPKLNNSLNVVAKVGEEHRGQNKYLMYPGQKLTVNESVVFEEFLDNARSFRVLLIGTDVFIIDYFDDPKNPKPIEQRWIKNLNPILEENLHHEKYRDAIDDAKHLSKALAFDYLGVDYVQNEEKLVCLEANTFPGVRLNERTRRVALNYWIKKISEIKDKRNV